MNKYIWVVIRRRMSFRRILRLIKDFATTFDAAFYRREANSMVSHLFPRAHFVIQGQRAGNKPHLNFNILEYSKTFPRTPIKSQFPFFHYLLTTSSINPGTSWDNYYLQVFPEAPTRSSSPTRASWPGAPVTSYG